MLAKTKNAIIWWCTFCWWWLLLCI